MRLQRTESRDVTAASTADLRIRIQAVTLFAIRPGR